MSLTNGPLKGIMVNYKYNELNQLTQVGDTTYKYDGEGTRISQAYKNGQITYVTDANAGLSRVLQTTENGKTKLYVYGLGLISEEEVINGARANFRVYHYDYRGSTIMLTNQSGAMTDHYVYDAYGELLVSAGNTKTMFLYVGKYGVETDKNGLIYMRARYYNTDTQRFVNEDPIKDGLNWYGYVSGNPVKIVDPSGLESMDIFYGLLESLDDNGLSGIGKDIHEYLFGAFTWGVQSEFDYYLGRLIGDAISMMSGTALSASGIAEIIASIASGATITITSGGTLTIGGITIATAGVAAGTVTAAYGTAVAASGANNFGKDLAKFIEINKSSGSASSINWKGFSKGQLDKHYQKHVVEGNEFGNITKNEYLKQAKAFAAEINSKFKETIVGKFIVKYDELTRRIFIGYTKDREIRTFYKADFRDADPFQAALELAKELSGIK